MQEAKKYDGDAIVRETAEKKNIYIFIYILIKEKLKKVIFYTNQ